MNQHQNQLPNKEDLENTASVAPSMDEVSKGRIEALARSKFYGWEVSKENRYLGLVQKSLKSI